MNLDETETERMAREVYGIECVGVLLANRQRAEEAHNLDGLYLSLAFRYGVECALA